MSLQETIDILRTGTADGPHQGRLFLVGGLLRDRHLGLEPEQDVDIVCLDDALAVAERLHRRGITDHAPVVYPRFGTAMVGVGGIHVEFATARRESYASTSRKPVVEPATLEEDVIRRDFTVNTLLQNLHTGEVLDLTGKAFSDMEAGVIRTPLSPDATFTDDPLRMLRAVRFAAKLDFIIEPACWESIKTCRHRLEIISNERIRDELNKTILLPQAARGLQLLLDSRLLETFAPELAAMYGVTQNKFHLYDVWTHTLKAIESLPDSAPLETRLGMLFHDVGKPPTRSEDPDGGVHFYGHQQVGASMARAILHRLKYPNHTIEAVVRLVDRHMRIGEYKPDWSDSAVRRLVRDLGEQMDELFVISDADKAACNPEYHYLDSSEVRARIEKVQQEADYTKVQSPLDGREIMELAGIGQGRQVGELKEMLINEVLEGRLQQEDKEMARRILKEHLESKR